MKIPLYYNSNYNITYESPIFDYCARSLDILLAVRCQIIHQHLRLNDFQTLQMNDSIVLRSIFPILDSSKMPHTNLLNNRCCN